jgi:hypothetical protein
MGEGGMTRELLLLAVWLIQFALALAVLAQ